MNDPFPFFVKHIPEVKGENVFGLFQRPHLPATHNRCDAKVAAAKSLLVTVLPDVLVVQLGRFEFGPSGACKLGHDVTIPSLLDLQPYVGDGRPSGGDGAMYELHAGVLHTGVRCMG